MIGARATGGMAPRKRPAGAAAAPAAKSSKGAPAAVAAGAAAVAEANVRSLFGQQRDFADAFFATLDYKEVEALVAAMCACKGVVLWTGVGKSAFVAKKVNQTLVSTGTRSMYLAPVDALHGDIGIVDHNDLLVMMSKSGDTQELVTLVPYAKAKGAKLVALTAKPQSPLAQVADLHVTVPATGELQAFDLSAPGESRQTPPTTYNAMQMLLGDTIAVALMHAKGLTKEEYAKNHPAGRIGKRLVLKVSDVMLDSNLPTVRPGEGGLQALMQLSQGSAGCGALLVVDDTNRLLGTFSDGDLRRALTARGQDVLELSVMELMNFSKAFPRVCHPEEMAQAAQERMASPSPVTYLPVVSSDGKRKLLGVLTLQDCAAAGL